MSEHKQTTDELVMEVRDLLGPTLWTTFCQWHEAFYASLQATKEAHDLLSDLESPGTIRGWLLGTDEFAGCSPFELLIHDPKEALVSARRFAAYG